MTIQELSRELQELMNKSRVTGLTIRRRDHLWYAVADKQGVITTASSNVELSVVLIELLDSA